MRSTFTAAAAAALVAAALLTGCGSDTADGDKTNGGKATVSQSASPTAGAGGEKHTVTLEVTGSGTAKIGYDLSTNAFETHKLPWTKTGTIELTGAELRVGHLVSVVPGLVPAGDGMLKTAACVIKVDGKQVADNNGGKSPKPCEYLLK
ncbi:hypothetical protein [Streptomyces olivochromogenes]|uniref:hypothetical protein n=1 Tax=Streptomyces olivochromogenes TaxID=1963 RepID=UPI001F338A42|nr:hypothetical protein [Streptomyces olivochromogenes]MCF3135033.1 hypothetical protein [Streptomyces olivochromogenes]